MKKVVFIFDPNGEGTSYRLRKTAPRLASQETPEQVAQHARDALPGDFARKVHLKRDTKQLLEQPVPPTAIYYIIADGKIRRLTTGEEVSPQHLRAQHRAAWAYTILRSPGDVNEVFMALSLSHDLASLGYEKVILAGNIHWADVQQYEKLDQAIVSLDDCSGTFGQPLTPEKDYLIHKIFALLGIQGEKFHPYQETRPRVNIPIR